MNINETKKWKDAVIEGLEKGLIVESSFGKMNIQDIFRLPMEKLDQVYIENAKKIAPVGLGEVGIRPELVLSLEIIKGVYESKKSAEEERKITAEKHAEIKKLERALANKQDAEIMEMSEEDIKKRLEELKK